MGRDKLFMDSLVSEVEQNVNGIRVDKEEDADESSGTDPGS